MAPYRTNHRPSARLRPSTPPRKLHESPNLASPPTTPIPAMDSSGDVIMGAQSVLVPPSPNFPSGLFEQDHHPPPSPGVCMRKAKTQLVPHDRTGAGIKKSKAENKSIACKLTGTTTAVAMTTLSQNSDHKPFRFMDLPGEIRNLVYDHIFNDPKQALLVHRPRMASLRLRTRLDRQRSLESDIKDRELGYQLSLSTDKSLRTNKDTETNKERQTNRPFWGLTQASRQIRHEFRPIYLAKQEIGMDLTEVVKYLQTFYFTAPTEFAKLNINGHRTEDMPLNGNLTIAVGDKPNNLERDSRGIEVIPLLDLWANSFKIEAGFGRYMKKDYIPQTDGEAKDLYRLFGRRVLRNRQCSGMNNLWRTILRARALASVTLHRKPASLTIDTATIPLEALTNALLAAQGPLPFPLPPRLIIRPRPYIHLLFRARCAEPWMTKFVSKIPDNWLVLHGFSGMEYFDIKVGLAPASLDYRV